MLMNAHQASQSTWDQLLVLPRTVGLPLIAKSSAAQPILTVACQPVDPGGRR